MWSSDKDFFADMTQIDDFGVNVDSYIDIERIERENVSKVLQQKQGKLKQSFFLDDSDEESKESENMYMSTASSDDILVVSSGIAQQIEKVNGRMYNNEYICEELYPQRRQKRELPESSTNDEEFPTVGQSVIFQPKINIKPLDPKHEIKPLDHTVNNRLPKTLKKPLDPKHEIKPLNHTNNNILPKPVKKPKKLSIASNIEKSVMSIKNAEIKTDIKPKIDEKPMEARCRFSLPIVNGGIHYNGIVVNKNNNENNSNGSWSPNYSWSDVDSNWSDLTTSSTMSEFNYYDNYESRNRKKCHDVSDSTKKMIDINSKTDFPFL